MDSDVAVAQLEQAMTHMVVAVCELRGITVDEYAEEKAAEYVAERATRET